MYIYDSVDRYPQPKSYRYSCWYVVYARTRILSIILSPALSALRAYALLKPRLAVPAVISCLGLTAVAINIVCILFYIFCYYRTY